MVRFVMLFDKLGAVRNAGLREATFLEQKLMEVHAHHVGIRENKLGL